jgi:hypothetical protein
MLEVADAPEERIPQGGSREKPSVLPTTISSALAFTNSI